MRSNPLNGVGRLSALSVAERVKIAGNAKLKQVGLNVSVNRKLGPRVLVQGVHTEIYYEEFMEELFRSNLRNFCSESVKTNVRMNSRPCKVAPYGMSTLLEAGRCYIKWFSVRV